MCQNTSKRLDEAKLTWYKPRTMPKGITKTQGSCRCIRSARPHAEHLNWHENHGVSELEGKWLVKRKKERKNTYSVHMRRVLLVTVYAWRRCLHGA